MLEIVNMFGKNIFTRVGHFLGKMKKIMKNCSKKKKEGVSFREFI
jgi:sporulation protein YlmC with PRC-barrel domain